MNNVAFQHQSTVVKCESFLKYLRKSVKTKEYVRRSRSKEENIEAQSENYRAERKTYKMWKNVNDAGLKNPAILKLKQTSFKAYKAIGKAIDKQRNSGISQPKLTKTIWLPKVVRFVNLALNVDAFSQMKGKINYVGNESFYDDAESDIMSAAIKPENQIHALGYLDRCASASGECYDCPRTRNCNLVICVQCYEVEKTKICAMEWSEDKEKKIKKLTKFAKGGEKCLFFCITCTNIRHHKK
jgi:hypothetical protein